MIMLMQFFGLVLVEKELSELEIVDSVLTQVVRLESPRIFPIYNFLVLFSSGLNF